MTPLLVTLGAMIVVTHTIRHLSGCLGERWGGLLIGLPISSALTLLYCIWERGPQYAATAAEAGLLGLGATVAFAVATARCLSRSRRLALAVAAGTATYVVAALLVRGVGARLAPLSLLLSLGLIVAGHRSVRGLDSQGDGCVAQRRVSPGWKMLLRTAIPVVCRVNSTLGAETDSNIAASCGAAAKSKPSATRDIELVDTSMPGLSEHRRMKELEGGPKIADANASGYQRGQT